MEEQLPFELNELFGLHLYLGSISLLLGISFLCYVLYINRKLNWKYSIGIPMLYLMFSTSGSFLLFLYWGFSIDFMFGPFHLPTLLTASISVGILLKLFKLKVFKNNPVKK